MAINPDDVNYTPPSSVGREIGIMFAFIGAFLVTVVLYGLAWRIHQNRTHKEDIAHRKAFLSRIAPTANSSLDFDSSLGTTATVTAGSHNSYTAVPVSFQRARAHEVVFDRYGSVGNRAELPVHSREVSDADKERIRQNVSVSELPGARSSKPTGKRPAGRGI
ncbi:hypothetical protein N7468_003922 [Penicillium chermesinum]|uniref:Uncharacterized protein n=1 Tax=Penicillium chermesinum TaxID=63820 RepID=A0A9W9TSP9_9EURO|nr:uncharacterized protein N7468_003922 [Penicillium chermesinum]KAJ5239303.1 hypothetical protein N7468_003922 [Penicillium chermesinum]